MDQNEIFKNYCKHNTEDKAPPIPYNFTYRRVDYTIATDGHSMIMAPATQRWDRKEGPWDHMYESLDRFALRILTEFRSTGQLDALVLQELAGPPKWSKGALLEVRGLNSRPRDLLLVGNQHFGRLLVARVLAGWTSPMTEFGVIRMGKDDDVDKEKEEPDQLLPLVLRSDVWSAILMPINIELLDEGSRVTQYPEDFVLRRAPTTVGGPR